MEHTFLDLRIVFQPTQNQNHISIIQSWQLPSAVAFGPTFVSDNIKYILVCTNLSAMVHVATQCEVRFSDIRTYDTAVRYTYSMSSRQLQTLRSATPTACPAASYRHCGPLHLQHVQSPVTDTAARYTSSMSSRQLQTLRLVAPVQLTNGVLLIILWTVKPASRRGGHVILVRPSVRLTSGPPGVRHGQRAAAVFTYELSLLFHISDSQPGVPRRLRVHDIPDTL